MLRGRFGENTGRPLLDAYVALPRMRAEGPVSFLVDTGADRSIINPPDAELLGIDYEELVDRVEFSSVGGPIVEFQEDALFVFVDEGHVIHSYQLPVAIVRGRPAMLEIPSVLGRDVLDNWRMTYSPLEGRLTFRVLRADETVPVPR